MRKMIKSIIQKPFPFFYIITLTLVLLITSYTLQDISTFVLVREMEGRGVNYDAFREMKIDEMALQNAEKMIEKLLKKHPELNQYPYMDTLGYFTFSIVANGFQGMEGKVVSQKTFMTGIGKIAQSAFFQDLYKYYQAILLDVLYFPVPFIANLESDITYVDSWNGMRSYGGYRRHEGTDLMAGDKESGFFPVISITDGIVEKMGWLEQGGWRIGIRSPHGGYFYYAHLHSYAPNLEVNSEVIAGQLLGFMGDSGYGSEGTTGQFPVHLHMGIYFDIKTGNEMSVNPYYILKTLEKNRIQSFSYK